MCFRLFIPVWLAVHFFMSGVQASELCDQKQRDIFQGLYHKGEALFDREQFLLSAMHFSQARFFGCSAAEQEKADYGWGLSLYSLGETRETLHVLEGLRGKVNLTLEVAMALDVFQSFVMPESNLYPQAPSSRQKLQLWRLRGTEGFPSALEKGVPHSLELRQIAGDLKTIDDQWRLRPHRTPWVAGVASTVLPGLGQAYSGSFQAAAIAAVINGLFLAATVSLWDHNLKPAALASGLVFSMTYLGNIVNAVDSAKRFNQSAVRDLELKMKDELFPELRPLKVD